MIAALRERVETEVPERGEFRVVSESFRNPDNRLNATDIKLKITKPPVNIEGHETRRYLELVMYNLPSPYICERVLAAGTRQEIMTALYDDHLVQKILDKLPIMEQDLQDVS